MKPISKDEDEQKWPIGFDKDGNPNVVAYCPGGVDEYRRTQAQAKYRPDRIRVLFVGESPPVDSKGYFYCGRNRLLGEMKRALGDGRYDDKCFLASFKERGFYLDDLVRAPVSNPTATKLKNKRREARSDLAARIRDYKPSVIVCLLLGIRDDVEMAVLKARSDAPVHAVPFAPRHPLKFREGMGRLRPMLEGGDL
jgi:hypothetical protein